MNVSVDLNTIVSGLILAVLLYVARTLTAITQKQAVQDQAMQSDRERASETRARVIAVEQRVGELEVRIGPAERT